MAATPYNSVATVQDIVPGDAILGQSGEKAGTYGNAVAQAAAITAPATTASTSGSPIGYTTTTQADAIVTAVRSIITALKNFGITA